MQYTAALPGSIPSGWIDYFNGIDSKHTDALDASLVEGTVVIGDLILLEILQGFRQDKDYQSAKTKLALLEQFKILRHGMAVKCATHYRSLRKKGITIRRTTDAIIALFCTVNKLPLLFQHRHSIPFEENLGLIQALKT